jgi:hypothetical protein
MPRTAPGVANDSGFSLLGAGKEISRLGHCQTNTSTGGLVSQEANLEWLT